MKRALYSFGADVRNKLRASLYEVAYLIQNSFIYLTLVLCAGGSVLLRATNVKDNQRQTKREY